MLLHTFIIKYILNLYVTLLYRIDGFKGTSRHYRIEGYKRLSSIWHCLLPRDAICRSFKWNHQNLKFLFPTNVMIRKLLKIAGMAMILKNA